MRPRVLLADDHTLLVDAFRKLLEPECEIVGTASNGRALVKLAVETRPDIILLDHAMPLLNGADAGQQVRQRLPDVKLIFVTANEDPDLAMETLSWGVSGYLLKKSAGSELLEAIRRVRRGKTYVTPFLDEGMMESFIQNPARKTRSQKLTPRQREVLQLLAEGYAMKEVAAILSISPRTVAFHKYRMMDTLRLKTNAELIQFAVKQNLVSSVR